MGGHSLLRAVACYREGRCTAFLSMHLPHLLRSVGGPEGMEAVAIMLSVLVTFCPVCGWQAVGAIHSLSECFDCSFSPLCVKLGRQELFFSEHRSSTMMRPSPVVSQHGLVLARP